MEEKIELNMFLNKLVSAVLRKFEKMERDIALLRSDVERFKQTGSMKDIEDKLRNLEFSVNSLKSKSQIDKSILKLIETDEQERKM
ncbi:hypothetical protein A3K64_00620 [Candidatus Micrarchaeota archaeon RBG_16_36_9]|nr:MAG: hypothetical protein A3K64_00620 [Candidatus Micrarchaeota archaeon RBG_16_36_9]